MLFRVMLVTVLGLLAQPVSAQTFDNLSDADRATLQAEIRAYLLANPELVFEMVKIIEDRKALEQIAQDIALVSANATELFDDGFSWVGGNPDGDVTVVEFLDYKCGYCKKAHDEVAELVRSDGNIRYIVKEFPILGPESELGARAALAILAASPASFPKFHDQLMRFNGPLNAETLARIAQDAGANPATMIAAMTDEKITLIINANRALAQRMHVDGTPMFVIGTQMQRGYAPLADMQARVAAARM